MQSHVSTVVWLSTSVTGQTPIDLSLCEYIWLLYQETTQRCYIQNVNDIWQHFIKVENISETLGTLICLPRKVFTFENHFGSSSASSCQVNNVRGSSLLFRQVELFVFVPEIFESELDTGFDSTGPILEWYLNAVIPSSRRNERSSKMLSPAFATWVYWDTDHVN